MSSVQTLFRPFKSRNLELENRLVMSPMTRSQSPGGIPGQNVADYYRRRAEGEVGLIITEGTTVPHPAASNDVNVPFFHGEAALAGWRQVLAGVHAAGGKIMPQLWHMGALRDAGTGPQPEVPSLSPANMTQQDIDAVIAAFVSSARHAHDLGFDGIELHGAHGYLIDQFFWEGQNRRTDAYGGSIEKRTRFAVEIISAIRAELGRDFPIMLRFSQWKLGDFEARLAHSPAELERFLKPLVEAGVDIFHASSRRFWEPEFTGSGLNLAGWTKKISGLPVITVGSVGLDLDFTASFGGQASKTRHIDDLLERLANEEFDLVAVGRALIGDPAWGKKVHEGRVQDIRLFEPADLQKLY